MLKRSLPATPTYSNLPISTPTYTLTPTHTSPHQHWHTYTHHRQHRATFKLATRHSQPLSSPIFASFSCFQDDSKGGDISEEARDSVLREGSARKRRKLSRRHSFSSDASTYLRMESPFGSQTQAGGVPGSQDITAPAAASPGQGPPPPSIKSPPPFARDRTPALFSRTGHNGSSLTPVTPAGPVSLNMAASDFVGTNTRPVLTSQAGQASAAAGPSRQTLDAPPAPRQFPLRLAQEQSPPPTSTSPPTKVLNRPRKRPAKLSLIVAPAAPSSAISSRIAAGNNGALDAPQRSFSSRSVPSSPSVSIPPLKKGDEGGHQLPSQQEEENKQLRDNLRGAPRRRPSVPFGLRIAPPPALIIPKKSFTAMAPTANSPSPSAGGARQPPIWQDPSEHILSGNGSSLQHARSVYAAGPVEVLPGLFLGDEFNACDDRCLADRGITTILNVAKETTLPFQFEKGVTEDPSSLDLSRRFEEHLKLRRRSEVTTPTSATRSIKPAVANVVEDTPMTATHEVFFTPVTAFAPPFSPIAAKLKNTEDQRARRARPVSMLPTSRTDSTIVGLQRDQGQQLQQQQQQQRDPGDVSPTQPPTPSSSILRNTTSTPNLFSRFSSSVITNKRRNSKIDRDSDDEDEFVDTSDTPLFDTSMTPTENREFSHDRELARLKLNGLASMSVDEEDRASGSRTTSPLSSHRSIYSEDTTPPSPTLALPDDAHGMYKAYDSEVSPSSSSREGARAATTSSSTATTTAATSSSSSPISAVALPPNAIALKIPPSPSSGRKEELRYVKLPWTHDEMDLAAVETGGFVVGCSIIAQALGIDPTTGQFSAQHEAKRGSILVHCQCGVSRSATLVIAFVMQAAALGYPFAEAKNLTGMHDCYEMVKDLSSSISPNCSLIYQLVEWERYLSKEAAKRREATMAANFPSASASTSSASASANALVLNEATTLSAGDDQQAAHGGYKPQAKGWGKEAMDEEDWTRMRLEEERKEAQEDESNRQRRLQEAVEQRKRDREREREQGAIDGASPSSSSSPSSASGGGLGARRKKKAPSLNLETSARAGIEKTALEEAVVSAPAVSIQKFSTKASTLGPTRESDEEREEPQARQEPSEPDRRSAEAERRERKRAPAPAASLSPEAALLSPSKSMPGSLPLPSPFDYVENTPTTASPRTPSTALSNNVLQNGGGKTRPRSLQAAPSGYAAGRPATSPFNAKASAPMTTTSSSSSGVFGAVGQSAQERKAKHRRTFSSELPSWKSASSLSVLLDQSAGSRSSER